MTFTQLQVISSYSLLQSTTKLTNLVQSAKEKGYEALALTDYNVLYGQLDFYKLCKKAGIKPILGIQLELKGNHYQEQTFPIVLLAKNYQGYQKLLKLSTIRSKEDESELKKELQFGLENIIGITSGEKGEVETLLANNEYEKAKEVVQFWKEIFSVNQFFLGVQLYQKMHPLIEPLQQLSKEVRVSMIALNEIRYLNSEDQFSCQVLQSIGSNEPIDIHSEEINGEYYLPAPEDIYNRYQAMGLGELADKTAEVANSIFIELPLNQPLLPKYPVPEGVSASEYLKKVCLEGLTMRMKKGKEDYLERLQYELSIIHEMGFDDYFLIVWDVMAFAKNASILPGAGRGSAAGSLVAYVLRITHVDPIEYNLLFERFLNKERYNMPDIDLDFPDDRRDEVLRYVKDKYGYHHVAQIITFGTLAAKMSIRDTSRVFGLTPAEASVWSNAIPNQIGIQLKDAYKQSKPLQRLVEKNTTNRLLFETAMKIEGVPRHISTHAAGVVISDQPLVELIPLQQRENELSLTQYPMGNVEEIGLLKMDFLGLKNLSILNDAVQLVEKAEGKAFDIFSIPINDSKTMQLFKESNTNGIFQFESAGIKNVLRKLGPENLEDLVAVNALYRPGPMEQIDTFISRKKGKQPIDYLHPDLEPILNVTYGVMVYQEQVMQVASKLAGFTLGEADILRRAIGKKEKATLNREKEHFIQGAINNGYEDKKAEEVYQYIERFANYGFNRSHSVAYSYIAYQMAYVKAHYPAAFFAALLNSANPHSDKMKSYLLDVIKQSIELTYPDINQSDWQYSLVNNQIQFGLSGVKGLRRDFISHILVERKQNGLYQDFVQFLRRISIKWLKSDLIIPLIASGAFDTFGHTRATLMGSLAGMLSSIEYSGNNVDLIEVLEPRYVEKEEFPLSELTELEEKYLGYSLLEHPIEEYRHLYKEDHIFYIGELTSKQSTRTMGLIREVKRIKTKKGDPMAFLTLTDATGMLNATLFPEQYVRYIKYLQEGQLVVLTGKYEDKRNENQSSFIVQKLVLMEEYLLQREKKNQRCFIRMTNEELYDKQFKELINLLKEFPGPCQVVLVDTVHDRKILLDEKYRFNPSKESVEKLNHLFGEKNVVIQ